MLNPPFLPLCKQRLIFESFSSPQIPSLIATFSLLNPRHHSPATITKPTPSLTAHLSFLSSPTFSFDIPLPLCLCCPVRKPGHMHMSSIKQTCMVGEKCFTYMPVIIMHYYIIILLYFHILVMETYRQAKCILKKMHVPNLLFFLPHGGSAMSCKHNRQL